MIALLLALPVLLSPLPQDTDVGALLSEAHRASGEIDPGHRLAARTWRAVAGALLDHGRADEARAIWTRAEAHSTRSVHLLAPLRARLHPIDETRSWLFSLTDRKGKALAAEWILRDAIRRDDGAAIRDALASLMACHHHGWDPGHDAWMIIGYHAVGDLEQVEGWTNMLVSEQVYPGMEPDFASAIADVVADRVGHDDLEGAEQLFAAFMKTKKKPLAVDSARLALLDAYLAAGRFDEAQAQRSALADALWRTKARADIAAAMDLAGRTDDATEQLRLAVAETKGSGFALEVVLTAVASAGLDARVEALVGPRLEAIDGSTPARDLIHLGVAAALTGDDDRVEAIEGRLDADERRRMVGRCGSSYDWTENSDALAALIARQEDPRCLFEVLDRVAYRREPTRGESHQAALTGLIVEHARRLPPAERALLLARVVRNGWAGGQ